jgi:hypothetical protein
MKNYIILFVCILFSSSIIAQTKTTEAAYKKDPNIPDFTILLTDSTWFSKEDLPKAGEYDYTIIVYFDPTCGHCQQEAAEIVKHMDGLKNVFFIFAAYRDFVEVKKFAAIYSLDQFPNVRIGRDPKYAIPAFYRVTKNPLIAVYNKKGKLEKVFDPAIEGTHIPDGAELVEYVKKKQ